MTNTAKKYDSKDFAESNFGIRSQADLVHIFNVLRNKMYTNKVLAVLREYSTNACDAHIESGQKDRPIEVTLPTPHARVLRIRDYGHGLTEDEVRNVYAMYGASTKRGSTELNGQLGFGSKAAFSYTDNYTIISYKDGTAYTYEAYVDETGLGAVSLVNKEPTTEPNGIEIRIDVQYQDVGNFIETARNLYKYFTVCPKVSNLPGVINRPAYTLRGTTWGLRSSPNQYYNPNENMIIMGNVAYPFNKNVIRDNLGQSADWRAFESLLNCPIDLFCPVGAVSIAASREALEYDKKTLRTLHDLFKTAIKEISENFNKRLSEAKDIVEAKQCYKLLVRGELQNLAKVVTTHGHLRWNDQVIDHFHLDLPVITHETTIDGAVHNKPSYEVRLITSAPSLVTGIRSINKTLGSDFEINNEFKAFYQDTDEKPILRVRKYFADNPGVNGVYLFKVGEHTTIDAIVEESDIPRKYFINLSTIAPLDVPNTRSAAPANAKHSRKVFTFNTGEVRGASSDSAYWEIAEIDDEEEKYWVHIDRFCPIVGGTLYPQRLRILIAEYQELTGEDISNKIVGIKLNAKFTPPANWKKLIDVVQKGLKDNLPKAQDDIIKSAYLESVNNNNVTSHFNTLNLRTLSNRITSSNSLAKKYLDQLNTAQQGRRNYLTLLTSIANAIGMSRDFIELEQAKENHSTRIVQETLDLTARYPLLNYLNNNAYTWGRYSHNESETAAKINHIIEYINLKDKEFNK